MSTARPLSYTVELMPDLEDLTFAGKVSIKIQPHAPGEDIVLDSVGLNIQSCRVAGENAGLESSYTVTKSAVCISFSSVQPEAITVSLEFSGKLEATMFGFYDASYEHDGRVKHLAVTQFESEHARRAFPCFDHPRYNTPFSIVLKAPAGTTAISNSAVESVEQVDRGALYRFKTTPPMPTYLLFFGVGDFECIEDTDYRIPIRVATVPGKSAYGRKAIEMAGAAITYCEEFTGIEYPMEKLDLIGLPAFAYGAMENLGAITYREKLLLYVPGATSERGAERNALITAHEVAHMWFGDLVSPLGWRFLWLNEAFATYLQYLITDVLLSDRRIGERFLLEGFIAAGSRDALKGTVPIELEEGRYLEVDASTAPIFYQKAGLILRMVRSWLGEEKFTAGIRAYLSEYAFQSTDTAGFLDSFGRGAGTEATGMIENWIRRPGYPIVRAKREGRRLFLEQERFTWLEHASEQVWHIPVYISLFDDSGERQKLSLLFREKRATVELPDDIKAYKINAGQIGFFHTAYEPENLKSLGKLAGERTLPPVDRFGLLLDLFALVMRGEIRVDEYTRFLLDHFAGEDEYLTLAFLAHVLPLLWRIAPGYRETVADAGKRVFEPVYGRIGIAPREGEEYLNVLLRSELLWPLALFGSGEVTGELLTRCKGFLEGESVDPELLECSLNSGAFSGSLGFDDFRRIIEDPAKPDELKSYAYGAIGWFQEEPVIHEVLEYTEKQMKAQERIYVYRAIAANPAAGKAAFRWLEENLPGIESMHHYIRSIAVAELVPVCEPENESVLTTLFERCSFEDDSLKQVVAIARELREVYRRINMRYGV